MATKMRMQVYGAWLYEGRWDGETPPPMEGWHLIRMIPGKFVGVPKGMFPKQGQVLLLMHGESCRVVEPSEQAQGR